MDDGVMYADLRLPPTRGNCALLPALGTPALLWVLCPSEAPWPLQGHSPSPAPLVCSFWVSSSKQLLSSPVADCSRGRGQERLKGTPVPQRTQSLAFPGLPNPCQVLSAGRVEVLQTGSPSHFLGFPTAS